MGPVHSTNPSTSSAINLSYWEPVSTMTLPRDRKERNFTTLRNVVNGMMIDQYEVQFKNEEEQIRYRNYCIQRSREATVVGVLYFSQESQGQLCGVGYRGKVFIEHMPYRLPNIKNVPLCEAIYILFIACHGFHKLYQQKGFFEIKQNHFCFTKSGELKVWLNSNLSKTEPESTGSPRENSQCQMVIKLLELIHSKFTYDQKTMTFKQYLHIKMNPSAVFALTFDQVKKYIRSYCNELKINIQNRCESMVNQHTRQRLRIQQHNVRTNLSIKKNNIRCKNQKTMEVAEIQHRRGHFDRKDTCHLVEINEYMNYSIQESRAVNVIWEENQNKSKPKQPQQQRHDRISTLVDDLLSQVSTSQNCKPYTPSPVRISYFDAIVEEQPQPQPQYGQIQQPESPKLVESTAASTPRGHNYSERALSKCRYNTIESSIQIDPLIAQDLLKYL